MGSDDGVSESQSHARLEERGIEEVKKEVENKKIDGHPLLCFFGASPPYTFLPNKEKKLHPPRRSFPDACISLDSDGW
jgi:hypothetical protein